LAQFDLNNHWPDQFENIKDTILFFRSEYRSNPAFAARVDEAVSRVLRLKLELYPDSTPSSVLVDPQVAMRVAGGGEMAVSDISRGSVTQISPDGYAGPSRASALPAPPRPDETLLVISDVRQVRDCYDCPTYSALPVTEVQDTILRLYGPDGTGQVSPERISSLNFAQLKSLLTGPLSESSGEALPPAEPVDGDYLAPEEIAARVQAADWIIFVPLDLNTARYPDSDALKLFLAQGASALFDKRVVVLALNAPYYLDATEISKLDAYLCAYSKIGPVVESAVRVLFGETTAAGASPVNVEGVGYDLAVQLLPDPDQPMTVRFLDEVPSDPVPPVTVRVGVGPVLDRNGNPVPDGTTITLAASYRGGAGPVGLAMATTTGGMAEAILVLPESGQAEIVAQSGDAISQYPLILMIAAPPTPTPTATSTPTATVRPSPTPSVTPPPPATSAPTSTSTLLPAPTSSPTSLPPEVSGGREGSATSRRVDGLDLLSALSATLLAGIIAISLQRKPERRLSKKVRLGLLVLIGGLVGYVLYAVGWLRPETWLVHGREMVLLAGRLAAGGLAFIFALAAFFLEGPLERSR
jgi:beta-N-acetylhexosaminidase